MLSLDDIIGAKDNFEAKRAIAVKMFRNSFETKDICELLNVSISFVSKWKIIFENEGAEGLLLNYKGSTGFLSDSDRSDIVFHFSDKLHCSIDDVMDYIRNNYGVVYQSKQSYYDIMKEAGLSWHRTQSANPERDEDKVLAKREEIKSKLEEYKDEIESGEVVVYAEDESHLRWGDAEGYVWGQRNERTEVPIKNVAERQTYYGALDIYNGKFVIIFYSLGNGENTVLFIKYLQSLNPGKRLLIIWDGASYHRCKKVKDYLDEVNRGLEEKYWKVTLIQFAPNSPDQNPVEDIWLKGKNYLRKHFYENRTFHQVKNCFYNFLDKKIFKFNKLHWYLGFPQPI